MFTLDASDGEILWSKMVVPQGKGGSAHRGHAIRADGKGNIYIAGIDYSSGGAQGPFLAKLTGSDDTGEPSLLRDLIDRFRFGQSRGSMSIFADADGEDREVSTISQPVELIAQCIVASAGDELLLQSGSIDHIRGILVVRAPRRVHERIAEMLRQLDDAGGD